MQRTGKIITTRIGGDPPSGGESPRRTAAEATAAAAETVATPETVAAAAAVAEQTSQSSHGPQPAEVEAPQAAQVVEHAGEEEAVLPVAESAAVDEAIDVAAAAEAAETAEPAEVAEPTETVEVAQVAAGAAQAEPATAGPPAHADSGAAKVAPPPTPPAQPRRPKGEHGPKLSKKDLKKKRADEQKIKAFRDYFNFAEEVRKIPPHRTLAINRGERAKVLRVKIEADLAAMYAAVDELLVPAEHPHADYLRGCAAIRWRG